MPTLKQLEAFKTSFLTIGNEPTALAGRNRVPDDYPLPESEPVASSPFGEAPARVPDGSIESADFADSMDQDFDNDADFPPPEDSSADSTFDFSAFLDTIPDNLSQIPDVDDEFGVSDSSEFSDTDEALDLEDLESESTEAFPLVPPSDYADEEDIIAGADTNPLDLSDDEALSLFSEEPAGMVPNTTPDEDFGISEMDEAEALDSFDGIDEADEGFALPDEDFGISGMDEADEGFALPDEDFGSMGDADEDYGISEGEALDSPYDDSAVQDYDTSLEAEDLDELPADPFDAFSLEDEHPVTEFSLPDSEGEAASAAPTQPSSSMDDFSLAGIDDIFDSSQPSRGARPSAAPSVAATGEPGGIDSVEEINLTPADFARLQETLSSYPLNLRVAIEEIIAEQVVNPDLMSSLISHLVRGATPRDSATLAGKILGRTIAIPRGFEKKTGEELEAEKTSFKYLFINRFIPVFRVFLGGAAAATALFFIIFQFVYTPIRAELLYRSGYERIPTGEYQQANERFNQALRVRRDRKWFYRYAEAFIDKRQFVFAEEKYDLLLQVFPRDKKGALDYAALQVDYLSNYSKADQIIRHNILDYSLDDRDGLLALGDVNLAWGEIDPSRYENARAAYARLLEKYGWKDPVVERMLLYFIRTDNLGEVIPLQEHFSSRSRRIRATTLAELGGYLLDKRLEVPRGVPDANIERIVGIRDILFRAIGAAEDDAARESRREGRTIVPPPEPYYHLARYYNRYGSAWEERLTLERAIGAFDAAATETPRRAAYRLDGMRRYAQILIDGREFFAAEEQLVKAIGVYESALSRRLLPRSPEYGRLYTDLGDLEFFTKDGDMKTALEYYARGELHGWAPPEVLYRMGYAHYALREWEQALERFFTASSELPQSRRMLNALGNASYMRGNYFAAQGYYRRLLDLLNDERARFARLYPNDRQDHWELSERIMAVRNNMGVALEGLTERTGDMAYRSEALGMYTESARAWDTLTRDPETMIRSGAGELSSPGINQAYLNARNLLYPQPGYEAQIYMEIDKDVMEPSRWEELGFIGYTIN